MPHPGGILSSSQAASVFPGDRRQKRRIVSVTRKGLQPYLTRGFQFALDVTMLGLAFALAYLLRFDFAIPSTRSADAIRQLPYVVLIQLAALALAGVYSFIWRYVGLGEVKAFLYAATWSGSRWGFCASRCLLVWAGGSPAVRHLDGYRPGVRRRPRPARPAPLPLRALAAQRARVSGRRRGARVDVARRCGASRHAGGAGDRRGDMNLDVKGFLDDDPEKQGA